MREQGNWKLSEEQRELTSKVVYDEWRKYKILDNQYEIIKVNTLEDELYNNNIERLYALHHFIGPCLEVLKANSTKGRILAKCEKGMCMIKQPRCDNVPPSKGMQPLQEGPELVVRVDNIPFHNLKNSEVRCENNETGGMPKVMECFVQVKDEFIISLL